MNTVQAHRRIAAFRREFTPGHLALARQASLSVSLTPDLTYHLWLNFRQSATQPQKSLAIPWEAVSDLLLSNMIDEAGTELYEMPADVRAQLFQELREDPDLGPGRIRQVAEFLYLYADRLSRSSRYHLPGLAQTLRWNALAYLQDPRVIKDMAEAFARVGFRSGSEQLRLKAILDALAEPLLMGPQADDVQQLRRYAASARSWVVGDKEKARIDFADILAPGEALVIAGVTLPVPELDTARRERRVPSVSASGVATHERAWQIRPGVELGRVRHMFILIPGFMGSILKKDDRDVWALSGEGLSDYSRRLGNSVDRLRLDESDAIMDDVGDGVIATGLVEGVHLVPGLAEHAGYGALARRIPEAFGMKAGSIFTTQDEASFFTFPYDWRRDNRVSARRLQRFVESQLPRWRNWSGAKDARVVLIGYGMGGLIARYYVEALGGWRHCRALVTVGSPFRGFFGALNALAKGFGYLETDFQGPVRSLTSVYQLLPIYPAIEVDGRWKRVMETNVLPNVQQSRAETARIDFHEAMRLAHENNVAESAYRQLLIPLVGTRQDTLQSAAFVDGQIRLSYAPPRGLDLSLADGDGVVPRVSAVPAGLEDQRIERFQVERNGWLANTDQSVDALLDTLMQVGSDAVPGDFYGGESLVKRSVEAEPSDLPSPSQQVETLNEWAMGRFQRPSFGLRLDSVFSSTNPPTISMRVYDANVPVEVGVSVSGHKTGAISASQRATVPPDEIVQLTFNGLTPDLYTLSVSSSKASLSGPGSVHAAFEVVA